MWRLSEHSLSRIAQRNLSNTDIEYVVANGQRFHRAGALIYYLRQRDVPEWDRANNQRMRLNGTAVILTKDAQTVITVWRNRRGGLKRIRCKRKSDLRQIEREFL